MNRKQSVLFQVILWIYLLYPEFTPWIFYNEKYFPYFYYSTPFNIFLNFLNFYIFYLFILPVFFKRKWITWGIVTGLMYAGLFFLFRVGAFYLYDITIQIESAEEIQREYQDPLILASQLRIAVVYCIYALFTRFTIDWFQNQKQRADLINQTQKSELALLRSQINPHFLFNTLNNIYSLVYQKSTEAPQAVMKLSSIMRYMLYESNTNFVPLEKEVEYLQSFIDLQKLRLKNPEFIKFDIAGDIKNRMIAPMMLIPFVENAFKHCDKKAEAPGISMFIQTKNEKIVFHISNFIDTKANINKDTVGGIGLQNIRRRLELIYKDKYNLNFDHDDRSFALTLEIYD